MEHSEIKVLSEEAAFAETGFAERSRRPMGEKQHEWVETQELVDFCKCSITAWRAHRINLKLETAEVRRDQKFGAPKEGRIRSR